MIKLLCVGLREVSSGKTTLTSVLHQYYKEKGLESGIYKPRAGTNLWEHWPIVRESIQKGTFYGSDAKKLWITMKKSIPINLLNPVNRLWHPTVGENMWKELPDFIFDRVTKNGKDHFIFNTTIENPVNDKYIDKIVNNSEKNVIHKVSSRSDFESLGNLYNEALKWAENEFIDKYDILIYESYSDIGMPLSDMSDLDYVFVIEPLKISLYEGERYLKSYHLQSRITFEEKTHDIIEPLKPIERVTFPLFHEKLGDNLLQHITPTLEKYI